MPFSKGSVPDRLKGKGIPQHFIDQWIEVWNSVYDKTGDEGEAYRQANGVLNREMRKAGYKKDSQGKWHKEEKMSTNDVIERDFDKNVGKHGVDRDKLDSSSFVFPDERAFPITSPEDVPDAVHSWGRYKGKHSFDEFKRRLTALCRRKGPAYVAKLPQDWKKEEVDSGNVLIESIFEARDVKQEADGKMRFKFMCMRENSLSGNSRFYGSGFLDESINRTNAWMNKGNIATIYGTHGQALGGFFSLPTESPLGKIERFYRENNEMIGEGFISPTTKGKDMQQLIKDGVVMHMSIRAYEYESKPAKMSFNGEEKDVEDVKWAIIAGVDFCDQPGIAGAGIRQVFESVDIRDVEDTMDISELTLEMLQEQRPDLVNELVVERLEVLTQQVAALESEKAALEAKEPESKPEDQAKIAELTAKVEELTAQVEELTNVAAELRAKLTLNEKAATPLHKALVNRLAGVDMENAEAVQAARAAAINDVQIELGLIGGSNATDNRESDIGDKNHGKKRAMIPGVADDVLEVAASLSN